MKEVLIEYEDLIESVPPILMPLMKPYIHRIDEVISPGLIALTWTSINIPEYMTNLHNALKEFRSLVKNVSDILDVRVEAVLDDMSLTALCDLREDEPVTIQEFLQLTQQTVDEASEYLAKQSKLVELAVNDIIEILKKKLTDSERRNLSAEEGYECLTPDPKKPRCQECQPCTYYGMLNNFTQRNTETLIKCTRLTLDSIKRRLQASAKKFVINPMVDDKRAALFKADLVLYIPNILTKPNLDEIQASLNKVVQIILRMSESIEPWSHMQMHQRQVQELEKLTDEISEEVKTQGPGSVKSLNKLVADHKDIAKVVSQLSGIMNTFKSEVQELLAVFSVYNSLWKEEPQVKVKEFMDTKPILSEIHAQIKHFSDMETHIHAITASYKVGAVEFQTEQLKEGLIAECKNWKYAYAQELNKKCASEMDAILDLFDNITKRLSRPVKDLDDVRSHMAALSELREEEIKIDMTVQPIEEAYIMLNKYEIYFNDGNAERVDSLTYGYSKLRAQAQEVQDHLLQIQPHFKANLIDGVHVFKESEVVFVGEYDSRYGMF